VDYLIVLSKNQIDRVFPVRKPIIFLGRKEGEVDLVLDHKSVSKVHAKLTRKEDKYVILDLNSTNGVLLNGRQVDNALIKPGDKLELGVFHVILRREKDVADAQGQDPATEPFPGDPFQHTAAVPIETQLDQINHAYNRLQSLFLLCPVLLGALLLAAGGIGP